MFNTQGVGNEYKGVDEASSHYKDEQVSEMRNASSEINAPEEKDKQESDSIAKLRNSFNALQVRFTSLPDEGTSINEILNLMLDISKLMDSLMAVITKLLKTETEVIQGIQAQRSTVTVVGMNDLKGLSDDLGQKMTQIGNLNNLGGAGATAIDAKLEKYQSFAKNIEARAGRLKDYNSSLLEMFKSLLQIFQSLSSKINSR